MNPSSNPPVLHSNQLKTTLRYRPLLLTMTSARTRRIAKEVADIHNDDTSHIKASPVGNGDDLTHLKGSFHGPPGTPYEGGNYIIDVKIPNEYPFRPPIMKFDTKVWHPNVSSQTVSEDLGPTLSQTIWLMQSCSRAQSVLTRSPLLGLRFSQSNPLYCLYNLFSAHQNRRIRKMQRWRAC